MLWAIVHLGCSTSNIPICSSPVTDTFFVLKELSVADAYPQAQLQLYEEVLIIPKRVFFSL